MKTNEIITGLLFISAGSWLIFSKSADEFDLLYLLDGKYKESKKWRTFKRIVIGLILLTGGGSFLLKGVLN